jgi:hypothetical protein
MSAQPITSIPRYPAHVFVTDRETRRIKANHQQLQHVINRILVRLGVSDKAARGIVGIHGVFNGREADKFPALIAHKWTAQQLNFKGKEENSDVFVGRVLDAIKDAEIRCGRRFFFIKRADGVTQIMTSYEADYLGEVALWALAEAKGTEEWKKHPAKAITDALIDRAIERLPIRIEEAKESNGEGDADLEKVIKGIWTKIENVAEVNIKRSVEEGINPMPTLEKVYKRLQLLAEREWFKLRMSEENMRRRAAMNAGVIDGDDDCASGKNISDKICSTGDISELEEEEFIVPDEAGTPPQTVVPPPVQIQSNQELNYEASAQLYAQGGIPVFPCKLDKKPYTANGFKAATVDPEKINAWWSKKPDASIGIPTGKASGWIVLDVDPKAGGDASLTALIERIGGLPDTLTARTGSGGTHFFFEQPLDLEIRNSASKIGVGLDIRGEGGYVIVAPSPHPSGGRYEWISYHEPALFPEALIAMLASSDHKPISTDYKPRASSTALGPVFCEGERNDGLFRVGCAIWGKGQAEDLADLHYQLLDVNANRCSPSLPDAEVMKMAANITARYSRGIPIDNPQRTGGDA